MWQRVQKQHGSEHETEECEGQYTALFDATGDWEGVRHRSTFHYASHHSIMERPDDVDEPSLESVAHRPS